MKQEVKSPRPHSKKLFEWDSDKGILSLVRRQEKYMFELSKDLTFIPIEQTETARPENKK